MPQEEIFVKFARFVLVGSALLLASLPAFAGASGPITITVDENCHGNSTGFIVAALPCGFFADPGPGGLLGAMTYGLPTIGSGFVPGDLIILEPTEGISDIIRFNPLSPFQPPFNLSSLVFYSDNQDGAEDGADIGFPLSAYTNQVILIESGPEGGSNGVTYTPLPGQPGFNPDFPSVTYQIISDAAPEPASMGLVLAGAGLVLAGKYRARRKRA